MNILVLCPTKVEYLNFNNAIKDKQLKHIYVSHLCGVGKANAAASCAEYLTRNEGVFDIVAVVGYAAGSEEFKQGDIVAPCNAVYHDVIAPNGFIPELQKPYLLKGTDRAYIATGDRFVNGDFIDEWKLTHYPTEPWVFDMETAAIAHIACNRGVPTVCIKMISDVPQFGHNEHTYKEFVETHSDFSPFVEYLENEI